MADVKWIKITTDIFDDEKILMIESMPSADSIIVIWFKLLAFAGKQNNDGVFLMSNRIAYTDEMLASIFRREVNVVRLALKSFEKFGMIEIVNNVICIPNWNKHQTLDAYEKKKERDRLYQQNRRAVQRALIANNNLCENGLPLQQWKMVLDEFGHKCAYCGSEEDLEQEHIVPVKKGGLYEIGNIVPACRQCNARKNDKEFVGWYTKSDVYDEERFRHIVKYIEANKKSSDKSSDVVISERDKEEDKEKEEDIKDNISDSDESAPAPAKKSKPVKHKYGEYKNVLLTDDELEKLKAEYSDYEERIERLSSYVASTGKPYKSHYATIRNWARKDAEKPVRKEVVPSWIKKTPKNSFNSFSQQRDYDYGEIEKGLFENDP